MSYTAVYLAALAVAFVLALANRESRLLAAWMVADVIATMVLQDHELFKWMMLADASLFSIMSIATLGEETRWKLMSCGLIGTGVLVHVAYFSLGDDRYDFSYFHMYAEQWLFLLAMTALAGGDDNVWQRLSRLLERLRGSDRNAPRPVWVRAGRSASLPEEAP